MKLEKEFVVAKDRERVSAALDQDATFEVIFPDTKVVSSSGGTRETLTHYTALGQTRDIKFLFHTMPDKNVRFEKICDGNVWRSLEGEVLLEPMGKQTRVVLRMEGRTRTFVPEITIRVPMREQLDQMAKALRSRLESS